MLAVLAVVAACGDDDSEVADPTPAADAAGQDTGADEGERVQGEPASGEGEGAEQEPTPDAPPPTATALPEPTPEAEPAAIDIDVVALEGELSDVPIPNPPVRDDWTVEEFTFGGTATSYATVGELTPDGFWTAEPAQTANYRTRMIVRRPPADSFSGVVLVEWFNVTSGTDTAPDWGFIEEELQRSGHAYVGVSVQEVGVNGDDRDLVGGGLLDTRGLKVRDPDRYGALEHPGDAFAYDIMSQAGLVVASGDVLGGLDASHVIAIGQSQSAIFLTGYLNTVHPIAPVFDGFLIHSRGAGAPTPEGAGGFDFEAGVLIRTDLDVPVFQFEAETDVTVLGFGEARQPDTAQLVTWEVAGTGHSDTYTIAAAGGLPRDPSLGAIIGCETPINDGPHHEALLAATSHLVDWVVDGETPPPGVPLEVGADGEIVRDELGLALGGVRLPTVDAPLRSLSGDPAAGDGVCFLFGQTGEIPLESLRSRYGDFEGFATVVETAAAEAVAAGWLLEVDATTMVGEELARAETLGL